MAAATSPSDEILRRMCIGLRVPELKLELSRRGKDDNGKRAELVDRLITCLRADFGVVGTSAFTGDASSNVIISPNRSAYHVDVSQPMWGWSEKIKGPHVFLSTTNGKNGIRNTIIGSGLERGNFSGVCSDIVFTNGRHWFKFKGGDPASLLHLCFISVVDAGRTDSDLVELCTRGERNIYLDQGATGIVSLNCQNHQGDNFDWRRTYNETLVCLDADERRLSFFVDGALVHLVDNVTIPGRVAVWSKFEGHTGTLVLRTGVHPPV